MIIAVLCKSEDLAIKVCKATGMSWNSGDWDHKKLISEYFKKDRFYINVSGSGLCKGVYPEEDFNSSEITTAEEYLGYKKGETEMKTENVSIRGIVSNMYDSIKDAKLVDRWFGEELRHVDAVLMTAADRKVLLVEAKRLQKVEDEK